MSFSKHSLPSLKDKIAIVTGANTGLGFETSLGLASAGATVVLACRDQSKADIAKQAILQKVPKATVDILLLDLASLGSVHSFADAFVSRYDRLDILVENAGIMIPPFSKTEDGFERQMGVNYFGHFLLTNLLFPLIKSTPESRVVTLSSKAHENAKIDFKNLNAENGYSKFGAYGQSKLACLMFAMELQRRLHKSKIGAVAVSAHPGVSETELGRYVPKWLYTVLSPLFPFLTHQPPLAALPILYAAAGTDVQGGDYFGPTGFQGLKGDPGKVKPKRHALDEAVATKLWAVSEELTGKTFKV